jgi:hypothetical protein
MSVDKSTAKIVAFSFLGIGTVAFVLGYYYYHNQSDHKEYVSYSKWITVLSALCIIASASAGMAWKQSSSAPDIINFVNCVLASFLVVYGKYNDWSYLAIFLGTLIGILSCFEFILDD